MTLPLPELDDIDFNTLVEEARALIPRFAPDWTDHNAHDPGMTLLELVAWLVDQDLYQLGFISDAHIQAFAALLGVRPEAAVPASGLIWPDIQALSNDARRPGVSLRRGSPITSKEQPEIAFQLDADIHISPAQLLSVGGTAMDRRQLFAQSTVFSDDDSALAYFHFDRPLVERDQESDASAERSLATIALGVEVQPVLALPTGDDSVSDAPGRVVAEYRLKQARAPWRVLNVLHDSTHALDRSGLLLLQVPMAPFHREQKVASELRLHRRGKTHRLLPRLNHTAINVLPFVQLKRARAGVLSTSSNGLPNQRYDLPIQGLLGPLVLETDKDGKVSPWNRVSDFSDSGPQDRVFVLDSAANSITFGNGINGAIPSIEGQIRYRDHQLTLGRGGNVARGLHWLVPGAPLRRDGPYGQNRQALTEGRDASSIDDLITAARHHALERQVALSNEQLREAVEALAHFGIARAQVLLNYFPNLSRSHVAGVRTVVIVPARQSDQDPFRQPPRALLQALNTRLRERRVLGERLLASLAVPVPIRVKAELVLDETAPADEVLTVARRQLSARLSDITVPDSGVQPWPLGRPVSPQEIKSILAAVPGVMAVPQCGLARGDGTFLPASLKLAPDEIAIGSAYELLVSEGAPLLPQSEWHREGNHA